jgi:hypothetical protein
MFNIYLCTYSCQLNLRDSDDEVHQSESLCSWTLFVRNFKTLENTTFRKLDLFPSSGEWFRSDLSEVPNTLDVSLLSHEAVNRSSFRKVVFSIQNFRTMDKDQKLSDSKYKKLKARFNERWEYGQTYIIRFGASITEKRSSVPNVHTSASSWLQSCFVSFIPKSHKMPWTH